MTTQVKSNPLTKEEELVRRTVADLAEQFVARDKDYLFSANMLETLITSNRITVKDIAIMFYLELGKYFPNEQSGSGAST